MRAPNRLIDTSALAPKEREAAAREFLETITDVDVVGHSCPPEDRGRAVRQLAEANQGYESIGATADTARVRNRLRHLGVRRRHWTQSPGRPDRGWESLTETQHTVSELTAQGLNNRQIAAGMYLSSATVAFHLRQIFRKLDISSRVELTRIVVERNLSPSIPPPSREFMRRPPLGISMSPMN